MAEKKSNPAGVAILIILILLALFFIIKQAMPKKGVVSQPPTGAPTEEMPTSETEPLPAPESGTAK